MLQTCNNPSLDRPHCLLLLHLKCYLASSETCPWVVDSEFWRGCSRETDGTRYEDEIERVTWEVGEPKVVVVMGSRLIKDLCRRCCDDVRSWSLL